MGNWSAARALESKAQRALLIEVPKEKNARKQEGVVVIAPPLLRHTRVEKASAKAQLNLTCTSKEIHHDDLESSAI